MTYQPRAIATYLTDREHAHPEAATQAGTAIAAAWNQRDFWQAATLDPLTRCATTSPNMAAPADVLARLVRHFGTHVHDVPAWQPTTPQARQTEDTPRTPQTQWRPRRVLITGSRTWTDHTTIRTALAAVWHPTVVLVSGACPDGADHLCEQCWTTWGGRIERHPADWSGPCRPTCQPGHRRPHRRGGSICPAAGIYRNHHMVTLGADLCLAFIRDHSHGATDCADTADQAGIPTRRYPHHLGRAAA